MDFFKFSRKKSTSWSLPNHVQSQQTRPQDRIKNITPRVSLWHAIARLAPKVLAKNATTDAFEKKTQAHAKPIYSTEKNPGTNLRAAIPNIKDVGTLKPAQTGHMPATMARMDIETFNAYFDESDRRLGLSKIVTIGLQGAHAPLKEPTLLAYGLSDVAFLRMVYDCILLKDTAELKLTETPQKLSEVMTVIEQGQTIGYGKSAPSHILHRMSLCEPSINAYLAQVINPRMQQQNIPLYWSTRASHTEGVMLCASVTRDARGHDGKTVELKAKTSAFESIPNLGMIQSTIAGVTIYSQGPTLAEREKYQLRQDNNTYIGDDPKAIPYSPLWRKIGLSETQFFAIFEDLHACVNHHLAHPDNIAISDRKKILAHLGAIDSVVQEQLFENLTIVIAQNQARAEICRILDHHNIVMIQHNVPLRLMALDFGHPNNNATHMGGHMLALYSPKDVFQDQKDRFNFQLLLTHEAIASAQST